MEDRALLKKKTEEGFIPCYNHSCSRREHCLRWEARQYMPTTAWTTTCVNPGNPEAGGDSCQMFRGDEKVRMALGFTKLLNVMPRQTGKALMEALKKQYCRTYAYEYRNGTRPMTPAEQAVMTAICRQLGWTGDITFDAYRDDYEW